MRNMTTKQFRRALKYRNVVWKECEKQQIPARIERLRHAIQTKNILSNRQKNNLSQIDKFLTYVMTKQERGYKIPYHIPWSPELDHKYKRKKFFYVVVALL